MKWAIALASGITVGVAITHTLTPAPIDDEPPPELCYYGTYESGRQWERSDRPGSAVVKVMGNRLDAPVEIWVDCDTR